MRLLVKTLGGFAILLLLHTVSHAQNRFLSGNNADLATDLKKVIEDHPNHFKNITGELIIQNPQSSDYQCNLKIKGAEECFITRYAATEKEIYSWQALLLTTENFEEAKRKFKSLYGQLNNLRINSVPLKGEYEAPVEEKKFTGVLFSFPPEDEALKKLKVELTIESEGMEWKVKVLVYDREREDAERGNVVE
jgi:hypothetical protein